MAVGFFRMKGKVEIFAIASDGSEELIATEDNLIVNGAGEAIVNMLTTPSTVFGCNPEIMDVSNWRIGALSFGPAAASFQENAYYVTSEAIADSTSWVNVDRSLDSGKIVRCLWVSSTIGEGHGATASSYTPPYRLPSYPDPLDTLLEGDASTAFATVSANGTQCFGQFENRIEFNPNDSSSYLTGAYAPAEASPVWPYIALVSSLEGDFKDDFYNHMIVSSTQGGASHGYNGLGNIDYRGFIRVFSLSEAYVEHPHGSPAPFPEDIRGMAYVSGAVDSAHAVDFAKDPRIIVSTELHFDDLKMFQVFRGFHQLGLWTLDCKKSLQNGSSLNGDNTAPFNWIDSNGITPREFQLFAKKTFTEDLVKRSDEGGVSGFLNSFDLRITWTLDFRSKHA